MKIAYIANHGCGGNDDEGAIAYALRELGHDVLEIRKSKYAHDSDLILFHHDAIQEKRILNRIPKVFWWFDLVNCDDSTLHRRCHSRMQWMEEMTSVVDLGFMSDGDWVHKDKTGKLVHLFQGADSRIAKNYIKQRSPSILFTGISHGGGIKRESWVNEMRETYGYRFVHKRNVYREDLRFLVSKAQVMVAPDFPVTDLYWSNRVFMALGFGAFMIHPYCAGLARLYEHGREIVFYDSRDEMHRLIKHYIAHPSECEPIRQAGFERTMAEHTYLHRCRELLGVVKERLNIG